MNRKTLQELEKIVDVANHKANYPLTDSSRLGLTVHLALVIERIRKNDKIVMKEDILRELKKTEEYRLSEVIGKKIEKKYDIQMPESEFGYITMHLQGSRLKEIASERFDYEFSNFEIVRLANQIIQRIKEVNGKDLGDDEQFFSGLLAHLKPVLIRLKLNLEIRNPLLEEIKEKYTDYYELTLQCQKPLEVFIGQSVPDEETGFLAMHIGSALERRKASRKRKMRVILTCTTGIGSSKMLATRIAQEFKDIEIVDIDSICITEGLEKPYITEEWHPFFHKFYGRNVLGIKCESFKNPKEHTIVIFMDKFREFRNMVMLERIN